MLEFVEIDGIVGYHYFNFIFIIRVHAARTQINITIQFECKIENAYATFKSPQSLTDK